MAENSNYFNALAEILKQKPQENEHFEALGRFIAAFAHAEAQVHILARSLSKMDDERARIVFHGFRVTDSIDKLLALSRVGSGNRLFSFGGEPKLSPADLEIMTAAITQFQVIAATRHKLVHRTVRMTTAGLQVSNAFTAKSILHAENGFVVTLQDLKDMKSDCGVIFLQLDALARPGKGDGLDGPSWYGPWRYKPPQPALQKPKQKKAQKSRKPRPKS